MNGAVGGYDRYDPQKRYKITQFKPQAYCQWEPKVNNYGGFYAYNPGLDASQRPDQFEGIGNRHGKGAVILGFDTHTHFILLKTFQSEGLNTPGLLWCNPGTPNGM